MRGDVTDELRTMIVDMAEERGGDAAVREVLVELGDPAVLARRYSGEKRHLIGPALYDDYIGLLKALGVVALPALLLLLAVFELSDPDRPVVGGLVSAVGSTLGIAVHIAFWATLAFAILDRSGLSVEGHRVARTGDWEPERLPALPTARQIGLGDTVGAIVMLLAALVFLPWQHYRSAFEDAGGDPVPMLDPDLWSLWLPVFVGVVLVCLVVLVVLGVAVWDVLESLVKHTRTRRAAVTTAALGAPGH